jgi:hypothetical protein
LNTANQDIKILTITDQHVEFETPISCLTINPYTFFTSRAAPLFPLLSSGLKMYFQAVCQEPDQAGDTSGIKASI